VPLGPPRPASSVWTMRAIARAVGHSLYLHHLGTAADRAGLDRLNRRGHVAWTSPNDTCRFRERLSVSHLVKAWLQEVELRGLEPLTFSLRTRRATDCAIAPRIGVGRSARRLYHRQAEATWRDSPPASAGGASDAEPGASAVTGPSCRAEVGPPGPDRSIVRTVRGANGFET
jgi:hypothetical protein